MNFDMALHKAKSEIYMQGLISRRTGFSYTTEESSYTPLLLVGNMLYIYLPCCAERAT